MSQRPILHYATDRRCYNGALCSDLQKELDSRDDILNQVQIVEPEFRTVYFPVEGKYSGWIKYKEITSLYEDRGDALLEAWDKLIGTD
jgi:hypothetical protein